MKTLLQQITKTTLLFSAFTILAGCTCDNREHHHKKHHKYATEQEFVMVEMAEVTTMDIVEPNMVKAKIYTRNSKGGTSEMGYVKFIQTDNGTKMSMDLKYLRPGKDYTLKLYHCGTCNNDDCCDKTYMNVNLPMIMIDAPGKLKKTVDVRSINLNDLQNAKIVFTRDGGHKAAWGRLQPVMNY